MSSSSDTVLDELARGAGMGLLGRFVGRILSIAGDVIAARVLGPSIFGVYAIGWTLFRLIEVVSPLGLDRAVLRFAPRHLLDENFLAFKKVVIQSIILAFVFSAVIGCITFLLADWLANDIFRKSGLAYVLKFFAVAFPLGALLSVVAATTRLQRSVKYAVIIQDIGQPLSALVLLAALYYAVSEKLFAVLFSDVLSYLFALVLGFIFIRQLFPFVFTRFAFDWRMCPPLLKFSIPVAFGSSLGVLIYWVDRLFVGYFRPDIETGIYQVASQMSLLFAVILSGLSTILVPSFVTLFYQDDKIRLREIYKTGNKWGLYLGLPMLAVLILSPQRVLSVLYGDIYQSGSGVMVILLCGQAINLATGASAPLLVMSGKQNVWVFITSFSFLLDILLNFQFTPKYGMIGTAFATALSTAVMFLSILVAVYLLLGFWPYDARYIKGLFATTCAGLAVWLTGHLLFGDLIVLVLQSVAALFVFCGVLVLLKLDSEDKFFLNMIIQKINLLTRANNVK